MPRCLLLAGLAVVMIAGSFGCGEDEPTDPPSDPSGEIMPMEVDNRWDYQVHVYPETGSPYGYTDSIVINGLDTTDNVVSFVANGNDRFRSRSNGLWYLPASGGDWSLLFKYPVVINETWVTGGAGEARVRLLSKSADVSTPNGDYSCYKYVREYLYSSRGAEYIYLVPRIGIVRYEYWDSTNTRVGELGLLTDLYLAP
ncbi:MAG: hypothetical protein GY867_02080 [bacterium]|nr:hypothetical protein [bacterium]